jgi:ubiquinone/menaquinone biosynthesis C-methylase UbiE
MKIRDELLSTIFGMEHMDEMHEYPSMFSNIRYYQRLKARIIKRFIFNNYGLEKTFLDAGAGRGPYCVIASPLFKNVFCDEYDTAELAKAEVYIRAKKLENIEFLHNDLAKTSYQSNSIDIAVCSEVLEHIPNRQDAANELYRILKPGGKLLLSMPQKNSLFYRHVKKVHKDILSQPEPEDTNDGMWHFMQHVKFSTKDIEKIATNAGFTVKKRYGANVLPLGEKIFSKIYKIPIIFKTYIIAEFLLEAIFPRFASFYFIELTKNKK